MVPSPKDNQPGAWTRTRPSCVVENWKPAKVLSAALPPMITIDVAGRIVRVNQSKLCANPDP
eukprot:952998-Prorocentrum_lima.AAC.1